MNNKLVKYALFGIAVLLVSCEHSPDLVMDKVSIYTAPDLNNDSATAVDLVIVYDEDLVKHVGSMSACVFFASSQQLLLDYPTLLDIWHWELVPGQSVRNFSPPQDKGRAFGAYIFANYLTAGNHRLKVTPDGTVSVLLAKDKLKDLSGASASDMQRGKTATEAVLGKKPSKWTTGLLDTPGSVTVVPRGGPVSPPTPLPLTGGGTICQPQPCMVPKSPIVVKPLNPLPQTQSPCKCPTKR